MRRLVIAVSLALAGCGASTGPGDSADSDAARADASAADAGAPDARPSDAASPDAGLDAAPGRLSVQVESAPRAFVGVEHCISVRHNGGPEALVEVVWGDGSRERIDSATSAACHTYEIASGIVLGAIVEDRGMRADAAAPIYVLQAPAAHPPRASSSIVWDGARGRVIVVEEDSGTMAVIDAASLSRVAVLEVCERPRTVAIVGDQIWAACHGDGTIARVEAATLASLSSIELGEGSAPFGVISDPRDPQIAYVSLWASGELVAIDDEANVLSRIRIGPEPRALAMNDEGTLLVTRWRSRQEGAAVVVLDARDPRALRVVGDTTLPRQENLDSDTDNSGVLSFLGCVALSPDGRTAIVPALKANVVSGTFRSSTPLTSQTTARAALATLFLDAPGGLALDGYRRSFDDLDRASTAVFSPFGERAYVAIEGAEIVLAINAISLDVIGSIDAVGHAPIGLVLDPAGETLFVHASLSREVRAYDVRDLSRQPSALATLSTVEREPLDAIVLAGKQIFHSSRDPRMSRTRYLSCASCHADGEGDGLTWDFTQRGEGLRNTIGLRGRGALEGPLHWSANFDELQDFEHDIRAHQGGAGFLPDALFHVGTRDAPLGDPKAGLSPELDAMAAYVSSLTSSGVSPFRRDDDPVWVASFSRGEAIFRDPAVGCAGCHSGARFTDSALIAGAPRVHDVGTLSAGSGSRLGEALTGLDTPGLRGLWASAPYLHDGSAPTLRDVLIARNASDRHGRTSALDQRALSDLETFLLALDDRVP